MSENKVSYDYGYNVLRVDDKHIPTLTFGGGNIRVTDGWVEGDKLHGVLFSIEDKNHEIGIFPYPEIEGKGFDFVKNIKMYMRFDKVESIDVIISKLEACREKLLLNKGGEK